jgi:hypothetical protein
MSISKTYEMLRQIALTEFPDVIVWGDMPRLPSGEVLRLRLFLTDESFIEAYVSVTGRYSYRWERRLTGRPDIYRFDNAPHSRWRRVSTYPHHFHDGREDNVVSSSIKDDPLEGLREVCRFAREKLRRESREEQ